MPGYPSSSGTPAGYPQAPYSQYGQGLPGAGQPGQYGQGVPGAGQFGQYGQGQYGQSTPYGSYGQQHGPYGQQPAPYQPIPSQSSIWTSNSTSGFFARFALTRLIIAGISIGIFVVIGIIVAVVSALH